MLFQESCQELSIFQSDVPDIIKSSTARIENFDEDTIDREIVSDTVMNKRFIADYLQIFAFFTCFQC